MEVINDRSMPRTSTMRTIVLLLVSICLSIAIGLAMLITALTPASVAAPCTVAVVAPAHLTTSDACPLTTLSAKCCARPFLG
jgi:hypothetical protein